MVSEPVASVIGSVLEGRYRVLSLLGRGGMGDVYLSEDTQLKRRCALKVLHADLAGERTNVERFLREAQMIASLDHPNIVDIYSFGEDPSGLVYFAMELLTGEDLDARVKHRAKRPFSAHDCCVWAIEIAQAVAVVHDAGLIHRDLKVSNVFLTRRRDGRELCKLLDFGIARDEDGSELTKTGIALGTPSYMSPEQCRNAPLDRRSDVYSFGVLLFKLLVGKVPFTGDALQVAMQHCHTPPPVPSSMAPAAGISPALDALVLRALQKDPQARFQSMREVEAAIVEVLRAEAPDLAPLTRPPRSPHDTPGATMAAAPSMPHPAAALVPADAVTPGSPALQTGLTDAMPTPSPASSRVRRQVALLGVFLLGAAAIVWFIAAGRSPASDPAPVVASVATPIAPVAPPVPAPVASDPAPAPVVEPVLVVDEPAAPAEPGPRAAGEPASASSQKKSRPAAQASDPIAQVQRKALKCRKTHKAVDGPKITVDYSVGTDGKVTRSIAATSDELGKCLAASVMTTTFAPQLALGLTIKL